MEFEWDEAKRQEVLGQPSVDFVVAALVFEDPDRLEEVDTRRDYGEVRFRTVGMAAGELLMVVYTMRGTVRSLITAWKVGKNGRAKY